MSIEKSFRSFKQDMQRMKGVKEVGTIYSFEDALDIVREHLGDKLKGDEGIARDEDEKKDKSALRKLIEEAKSDIRDIVYGRNIRVRNTEPEQFIEQAAQEFVGYSVLAPAFYDPGVSDVYCIEFNNIRVERNGVDEVYEHHFRSPKHYKDFIDRVLLKGGSGVGKTINNGENKIVDAEFYGDRIIATSKVITPKDYSLTFRKHKESHVTLPEIIGQNVMSQEMADFFGHIIKGELNFVYAGITGSGKTTTIRALLDHYVSLLNKRMLVLEDTQELYPKNKHTLEMVTHKNANEKLNIDLYDLGVAALRLKPKYIVYGEVRGKEAQAAVESAETGHATIFTMHGGEPINILNRLVTKYLMAMPNLGIDVVERIIGNAIDYIAIQDDIPEIGRRVSIISEVTFNEESGRTQLTPIFEFDFEKETFVMLNKMSPDKAKRMLRRGVKREEIKHLVEGWA